MNIEITSKATQLKGIDSEGFTQAVFHGRMQSELKLSDNGAMQTLINSDAIRIGNQLFTRVIDTDQCELWNYEWETEKPAPDMHDEQSRRLLLEENVIAVV